MIKMERGSPAPLPSYGASKPSNFQGSAFLDPAPDVLSCTGETHTLAGDGEVLRTKDHSGGTNPDVPPTSTHPDTKFCASPILQSHPYPRPIPWQKRQSIKCVFCCCCFFFYTHISSISATKGRLSRTVRVEGQGWAFPQVPPT